MSIRALNQDPSLERTPIGRVSYRRLRNGDVVACAMKRGAKRARIVHTLEPQQTVWAALYGKAPLEAPRFNAMMARRRYEDERAAQRVKANGSQAYRADLRWLFRRHPDLARAVGALRPRTA